MNYLEYPKAIKMPNRKMRKSQRSVIWQKNKKLKKLEEKKRREERNG